MNLVVIRILIYGALLFWAFICLFPIYWTITTRFIPLEVSANIQLSSKVIYAWKHLVHVTFLIPFSTNFRSVVMKIIMMIK